MILYINSCVRKASRTNRLAEALLKQLGDYKELKLDEMELQPLNNDSLEYRSAEIEKCNFNADLFEMARNFAEADIIVISAPYWDGSFPAKLKVYFENIYVTGIVSKYGNDGRPQGLCKAQKLYYVTTAGGSYNPRYSYDYVTDLAVNMFGIKETELIYAENMDIFGNDAEDILKATIDGISC